MVKHIETKLTRWVAGKCAIVALMAASAGCSAGAGADTEGNVGTSEEAMSESSCATVTANQTFTGGADVTSPTSYNNCGKAYVVDITNFSSEFTGHGNCGDGGIEVSYADTTLSPTDCPNTLLRAIFYHTVNGAYVVEDDQQIYGQVGPLNECMLNLRGTGFNAGSHQRVAATARDVNGNTRAIRIETVPRCSIQ